MALSKDWRSKLKTAKEYPIESLGDTVRVRPMTAARQTAIDKQFATDKNGKLENPTAYLAALVADSVVDEDGKPLWTDAEVLNDLDFELFREVSAVVQKAIVPAMPKNSIPASDSPIA